MLHTGNYCNTSLWTRQFELDMSSIPLFVLAKAHETFKQRTSL